MTTVTQVSAQQEQLSWKWGWAAYVSELHYQLLSMKCGSQGLEKEREKERFGRK